MATLEQKIAAKIPGEDTGIRIKKTVCDICAPDHPCGIDAYVKDGKLLKVEGSPDHPYSQGHLCTKGLCSRQYVYREDRIRTPMKRVGPRGSGQLEPITWDEAYRTIAENLNRIKAEESAHSVAFFAGHGKWFRPMMQRFAYDFGSVNFGSDCSVCNLALIFGRIISAGCNFREDIPQRTEWLEFEEDLSGKKVTVWCIDKDTTNPYRLYQKMDIGIPNREELKLLRAEGRLKPVYEES